MRARAIAGILSMAVATGCADCGGTGDPDAGVDAGITADILCADLARRQCDFFIRCHADPTAAVTGFSLTDAGTFNVVPERERQRCEQALAAEPECEVIAASIATGRAAFDEADYLACVDSAYPQDTCDRDVIAALTQCRGYPFLDGTVEAAGGCALDQDCDQGYCTAAEVEACGSCQPASSTTGAPCTRDSMCAQATHYCTGEDGESGTCEPYTELGESCNFFDFNWEECGPGQVCALTGPFFTGQCVTAKGQGEQCDVNRWQCYRSGRGVVELACAPVTPPTGGTAVERCVPTQTTLNSPCGNGEGVEGFMLPLCPETQFCQNELCTDRLTAGMSCDPADDSCAFGLRCLVPQGGGAGTCEPYQPPEAACASDQDCQALLRCTGTGTCESRVKLPAEACGAGELCAAGYCASGTPTDSCQPLLEDGEACDAAEQCASGVCSTTCQDACWD